MLTQQIEELKARLVTYARFVEEMIEHSVKAVLEKKPDELRLIVEDSEKRANETELVLEQECTALIAQYQPRARDLRTILMALGMTNDLERMGDHAVNIAEAGISFLSHPGIVPPEKLSRLGGESLRMVDEGIQAFIVEEVELARKVCASDNVVDDLATEILKDQVAAMAREPSTIEGRLSLLKIAANLERIADLSTNLCEDVIYQVEGRVIKHHKEDEAR
jgi:phosphate transport system protein